MREWGLTPPQWRELSEEDRDEMLAEHDLVCPKCGNLRSVCSDPDVDWHPQTSTCWADATTQWGLRKLQEKHKDVEPAGNTLHPLDGVSVWVSDMDLDVEGSDFD